MWVGPLEGRYLALKMAGSRAGISFKLTLRLSVIR